MTIDTEIRHVTKPGANLFLELGFSAEEAKRLQTASHKQVNDTRQLKEQLMSELADWIEQHHLKQADAAKILMVSRPGLTVSDAVRVFLTRIVADKALPFALKAPNESSRAAIAEAGQIVKSRRARFETAEALLNGLEEASGK